MYSFIHSLLCFYPGGIAYRRNIRCVFGKPLNWFNALLKKKKNTYTCINQMQHLHACSSLMFWHLMVWISIPESMHYFNQFVYAGCAAKSVKTRSPSLNRDWTVQLKRAHSQCFEKLIPPFLRNMIFNPYPWEYFWKVNSVFRFRNQSLSIQCQDVLF